MTAEERFNWLMNFGSSLDGAILVGAPILFLVFFALIFAFYVRSKRKNELKSLESAMTLEGEAPSLEQSSLELLKKTKQSSSADIDEPETAVEEQLETAEEQQTETASPKDTFIEDLKNVDQSNWLSRLGKGLGKTRASLTTNISNLLTGKSKIDESMLENLHEILYRADIGVQASDRLVDRIRKGINSEDAANWDSIKEELKSESNKILQVSNVPLNRPKEGPWVIMMVGVNGVGKTTTIGKLAAHFVAEDKNVLLCAADTYRAAAVDQIKVWGDRMGVHVIAHKPGADPAAVAFDAVKSAKAKKADILLIDTAGRLHSKTDLMAELSKISRVIKKELPEAPHEVWLVIDSTTGQNALAQVKAFKEAADVSGLVVTKLDGTAKGGVILGVCEQYETPIRYIGVGEQAADLRAFAPEEFVDSLF